MNDDELLVGRYGRRSRLGQGAMGEVWLADDEVLHRPVAIKRIRPFEVADANAVERMRREARSAARLHHQNVVAVHDLVTDGEQPYLIMEYVSGRSLQEHIHSYGPLDAAQAADLLRQLAGGLAAAHGAGIVHRDIKPANVLIADDGTSKLTDFGIARTSGDGTLTEAGGILGTLLYMAPEVARGEPATPASDVWSLGATLFAAVEGAPALWRRRQC